MNKEISWEEKQSNRKESIKSEIKIDKRFILPDYVESKRKSLKVSKLLILDILDELVKEGYITIDRKQGVIELNDGLKENPLKESYKSEDICGLCGFEIIEKKVIIKDKVNVHEGCWQASKPEDFKKLMNS